MPSFDVVSEVDMTEVLNAVDQTRREIGTRYDFKGSKASVELHEKESTIDLKAEDKMKLDSLGDMLKQKLAKRGVSLRLVEFGEQEKAGGNTLKQTAKVKQGLTTEELKDLNKLVKQQKLKVTCQIQENQLRVTGKKRDILQEVISVLKSDAKNLELQFTNFRD